MFDRYLALWDLAPDGDPIVTFGARLLPVRRRGEAAMLKVATESEERFGGLLMAWWDGQGAARVLAADGDAMAELHAPRDKPLPELIPRPKPGDRLPHR